MARAASSSASWSASSCASWCARHPGPVLAVALLAAVGGELARRSLPRDAIPELADPRIAIVAEWMGRSATETAGAVTRVLTDGLEGLPGQVAIRGSSMAGMAYVEVVFPDVSALHDGRVEIVRRVAALRAKLPAGARVDVGPEASSTGWVIEYVLAIPSVNDAMHFVADPFAPLSPFGLRRFQDQVLRPALASVPGVVEVASVGGEVEQILVEARPAGLRSAGVAFLDVASAVRGAIAAPPAAGAAAVADWPARIGGAVAPSLGSVSVASDMPSGFVDQDGYIPAVGGVVIARRDADVAAVVAGVKRVLDRERPHLPEGATLIVAYERASLARRVEATEMRALAQEVVAVVIVMAAFLLHARSALVPLATLPLVVLLTFAAMWLGRVPITVMSLSGIGIALGMAVDADVVALEACHRRLEGAASGAGPPPRGWDRRALLDAAARSFTPAVVTSLIIAAVGFLPVLAFGGETGRLLRPLAFTKTLVIAAAALVAVTAAPALRDRLLGGSGPIVPEMRNPLTRGLVRLYQPFVHLALRHPAVTLVTAALAVASCLPVAARLGGEFLPRLDEDDLLFMPTTAPGVSLDQAAAALARQDQSMRTVREVESVFGKVGRAETATDPAPPSMAEITVRLRPPGERPKRRRARWYSAFAPAPLRRLLGVIWPEETRASAAEIIESLDKVARLPGWTSAWTAPARARMDMMSTGVRTAVGVRVVAAEPGRLDALGGAVSAALRRLPGTRSATYESLGEETRLAFVPDAEAMARHRVDPASVRATVELILSGGQLGEVERDGRRVRVRLLPDTRARLPDQARRDDERLIETTVRGLGPSGAPGAPVPLALLGRAAYVNGPAVVRVEHGELVAYVYADLDEGVDLRRYVDEARSAVELAVTDRRPGERFEWTGQYQLWAAGQRRLLIIAPVVLLSMLALLFLQFRSATEAAIVLASVPFALVGSVWALYLLGYRMSAPVWVGLLSVVGLAMQMGVVMVVYIDEAFYRRLREGRIASRDDIVAAHAEGTVRRLRPKLMTITTMAAGLAPLLWADGAGAEIMRRVAAPMLGGLASSAFLTLEALPVLYTIWRHRQLLRARRTGRALADVVGRPPPWAR